MSTGPVVALAGGVGAARFLRGLVQVVPPEQLTVIVNTGDDRDFFGLRVCPDLDIITYSLAGRVREATGWGLEGDTFQCLSGLQALGHETWFQLGDRDLATHIHRSARLQQGASLVEITREICQAFGVRVRLLPMTESAAPTRLLRRSGARSDFEEYLVRDGAPRDLEQVDLTQAARAKPAEGVLEAIEQAGTLLICPSNPVVSIGTIRKVAGIEALLRTRRRAVAISPIIAGQPVKGPADRLLRAIGVEVSALGVARLYREIATGFIIDGADRDLAQPIARMGMAVRVTDTLMKNSKISKELAVQAMDLSKEIR